MSDETRIRRYETMIVFRTDLQETGVKEQAERVRKLLDAQGATIGGIHEWGLRELAYVIQKEHRGYYVLCDYTASAAAVAELERNLKLSDHVLRFVSIRQDHDAPPVVPPREAGTSSTIDALPADDDQDIAVVDAEVGDAE